MAYSFPSDPWAAAYKVAINGNPKYATAGKDWTHGAVALLVKADETIGIGADMEEFFTGKRTVDKEGEAPVQPAKDAKEPAKNCAA